MTKSKPATLDSGVLRSHLEQALAATEKAGPIALKYFRRSLNVEDKSGGVDFDPVTEADREVESFLRRELTKRFPDYGITGEEQDDYLPAAPIRWIIDPIDGTRAFITGMPAWGILVGLLDNCDQQSDSGAERQDNDRSVSNAALANARALAGLMHQPFTGETFFAATGQKSWLRHNGQDTCLQTRSGVDLDEAVVQCTHPYMFETENEREDFSRVAKAARMCRFGGDCYSYCMLAMGQLDLVIEGGLKPYDIVPLIAIIEEAGGVVSNRHGRSATAGGFIVAAGDKNLHNQALELLNRSN